MSKVVIYILDKLVWMLIIAILTSQALQIAGIVEGPKVYSLRELNFYRQTNNEMFAPNINEGSNGVRAKRQAGDRSPLIDNLFNVPISTLNAVNEFIQSTRPVIQRLREAAQRRSSENDPNEKQRKDKAIKKVPSEDLREEDGPEVQADGSSSRVLLRV